MTFLVCKNYAPGFRTTGIRTPEVLATGLLETGLVLVAEGIEVTAVTFSFFLSAGTTESFSGFVMFPVFLVVSKGFFDADSVLTITVFPSPPIENP